MKVYSCSGSAFDDADGGAVYYRTKAEALAAARAQTAPCEISPDGSDAEVWVDEIFEPINHERIVNMLNREAWSAGHERVAVVSKGRVSA